MTQRVPVATGEPSGSQYVLRLDDQKAVATQVGGGLREYTVGGVPVVDGYPADQMCPGARGAVLAPWPNRLTSGRYHFDGEDHQLPIQAPGQPHAGHSLHGLVRWLSWYPISQTASSVTLGVDLAPQPGYPFAVHLTVTYALSARGLEVELSAQNRGLRACPYGVGAHPYVVVGSDTIESAVLTVPASRWQSMRADGYDTDVERTDNDFRHGRTIDGHPLGLFSGLERDDDGVALTVLRGQERCVTLWQDAAFPYVLLFGGVPSAPRRSLAIEPMSCPHEALNTGRDLIRLAPGQRHVARWGVRSERVA